MWKNRARLPSPLESTTVSSKAPLRGAELFNSSSISGYTPWKTSKISEAFLLNTDHDLLQ